MSTSPALAGTHCIYPYVTDEWTRAH